MTAVALIAGGPRSLVMGATLRPPRLRVQYRSAALVQEEFARRTGLRFSSARRRLFQAREDFPTGIQCAVARQCPSWLAWFIGPSELALAQAKVPQLELALVYHADHAQVDAREAVTRCFLTKTTEAARAAIRLCLHVASCWQQIAAAIAEDRGLAL